MRLYKSISEILVLYKENINNGELIDFLKKYQDDAYSKKGKKNRDRQIVDYEYKRVFKEYNKKKKEFMNNKDNISEIDNHLLILVEYSLNRLNLFFEADNLEQDSLDYMKNQLTYIEILLDLNNELYYEKYLLFCSELNRVRNLNEINKLKR